MGIVRVEDRTDDLSEAAQEEHDLRGHLDPDSEDLEVVAAVLAR